MISIFIIIRGVSTKVCERYHFTVNFITQVQYKTLLPKNVDVAVMIDELPGNIIYLEKNRNFHMSSLVIVRYFDHRDHALLRAFITEWSCLVKGPVR